MGSIRRAFSIPLFTKKHVAREVDEEIEFHVAERAARLIACGMESSAAYAEARRRFGDVDLVRRECIDTDTADWREGRVRTFLDQTVADVRFAARSLRRAPAFSVIALTTLTLGIALLGAIFSYYNAVYLAAFPYRDASRIVALAEQRKLRRSFDFTAVSLDAVQMLRHDARSFEHLSVYTTSHPTVLFGDTPQQISTLAVDTAFIPLLGLRPELGRLIAPEEIAANAPVTMISDVLWRARFGTAADVVTRSIDFDGVSYRIVGVMPIGFRFPYQTDAITPLVERADSGATTRGTFVALIGKLRRGISRQQARNEMAVLGARLAAIDKKDYTGASIVVRDEMLDRQGENFLPLPSVFLGAGLFLLLIACSNVGNFFYVRAAERRTEMAIRASLGAGTGRLVRQALAESALISASAAMMGTAAAFALVRLWLHMVPTTGFPSWFHIGVDWRILAFCIAVTAIVTVAAGLAPARVGARFDLVRTLKGSDAGAADRSVTRGSKRGLVLQLALSVALFVASALLLRSYQSLLHLDLGYPAGQIATVEPLFSPKMYGDLSLRMQFADRIMERGRTLPGVDHIGMRGGFVEFRGATVDTKKRYGSSGERFDARVIPDGDTLRAVNSQRHGFYRSYVVSDDFFKVIGLETRAGRTFTESDDASSDHSVVISARAASLLWGNRPAVGHTVQLGRFGEPLHVVGVVSDMRELRGGRDGFHATPGLNFYLTERQAVASNPEILARVRGDAIRTHEQLADLVRQADPRLTLFRDATMANQLDQPYLIMKVFGAVIGALALSGLLLAIIGIYGVVAFGVAQRTREIGIRMALGGTVGDVTRMITRETARFTAIGLGIGLALAAGVGRLVGAFLFNVSPVDPIAYAGTAIVFGAVSLAAAYLPARRVARVDPVAALKSD